MARKNAGFKDVELQPTSKMPRCGKITCQSGETKDGSARKWPYMKVGNDCDMDEVWKTLTEGPTEEWGLKPPKLIICVTGGAKNYNPRTATRLKALIKDDLINAADTADAWIMTGGTSVGVAKYVGKAVRDYYIQKPEKKKIVALGIAALDYIANGSDFDEAKACTDSVRYNFVGEKRKDNSDEEAESPPPPPPPPPPLDRHHTHFLLVEREAIEFMSKLQQHIHEKHNVMRVLIVAEGGLDTLKCVKTFIERGCPVVVIAGSGRAADLISEVYSSVKYETREKKGLTEQEVQDIAKMAADIFEDKKAAEILKDCFEAGHQLINIFNLEEEDSGTDIQSAILGALFKNSETTSTDQLRFAMKWKQCDAATRKILSHRRWTLQESDLHNMMFKALVINQDDFVQLLLDNTVKLRGFLKTETLEELYRSCMEESHDMKELLTYSFWMKPSRTFTRFKAAPDPTIPKHVLLLINEVMIHLFKDPHFSFYPPNEEEPKLYDHPQRELFLWAILFNREKLSLRFWKAGRDLIGGALCASVLLKRLSARAEKKDMAELSQSLARHSAVWEERAVAVLAECHSRDHNKTRRLLAREQLHWAPRALDVADTKGKKAIERPSLLNIAESYELMEFAAHSACQTKLSLIWNGRLSIYTPTWKVFLCVIFPVLLLSPIFKFTIVNSEDGSQSNEPNRKGNRVSDQKGQSPTEQVERRSVQRSMRVSCFKAGAKNKKIPRCEACRYFWTAPITKFAFNVLSYVAYLSMLSYFMLVELNEVSPSLVEYITWVWLATMILEEIRQMFFGSRLSLKYRFRNWVRSMWNQFDVVLYLTFLVAIALRFLLPPAGGDFRWVRAFYSVALVLSYLRLLQFFYVVKSVGPKVIMIQKMMGDVLLFLSFLLVFLIGFGVAYHINIFPESPPDWYMLVNIVYFPYFQIFGELFLDSMKGEVVDGCETNKTLWRLNPSTRCPEKSPVIMSLMLGVYLIVTNILLVNLLIAMFSNTFQNVQENSLRLWRYNRLSLVQEYFDRPVFAPPFIVLDYIYRVITCLCCQKSRSRKNDDNRFRIELSKEEHEVMTLFEKKAMLHSKAAEAPKERHDLGRKNVSEA